MNKKQLGADLALLFVAAIWGATFVTVKNALADITPFYFNALRFSLAALILGVISWRKLPLLNKSLIASGSLIGFFLFAGYSFQTIGLQYTSASNAGFITGLSVVLVPFFSIYFSKKAPSLEAT
ncbi:MAG: DMT family transporter, partial [Desulfitobacteriaceae bacterium]|nr:DMT family transporter [Desulfitobacteriaceae bacterium]